MAWGEARRPPPPCGCDGCSRPTLNALADELDAERARADRMAELLQADYPYDPSEVLAQHAAARLAASRARR